MILGSSLHISCIDFTSLYRCEVGLCLPAALASSLRHDSHGTTRVDAILQLILAYPLRWLHHFGTDLKRDTWPWKEPCVILVSSLHVSCNKLTVRNISLHLPCVHLAVRQNPCMTLARSLHYPCLQKWLSPNCALSLHFLADPCLILASSLQFFSKGDCKFWAQRSLRIK